MATGVAALPDDALAGVLRALPMQSQAVVRCVCKAWRDMVDGRALLLPPHHLPHSVRGVFVNYVDHERPHHFVRPCSSSTFPGVDGMLSFLPNDDEDWWSVLDHGSGLLLCDIERESELCVCNPATRRWTVLPPSADGGKRPHHHQYAGAYIAFDPAASPHYQVILVADVPKAPSAKDRRRAEQEWRRRRKVQLQGDWDAPFCLDGLFSLPEYGTSFGEDETEADEEFQSADEDGQEHEIDPCRLLSPEDGTVFGEDETDLVSGHDKEFQAADDDDLEREIDPCRLMEWPPTPWMLRVFSSRTGQWEERAFVREGMAAGTVEKMRLDPETPSIYHGLRRRYAVYHHGSLYVHCRGYFVARLSLSNSNYQIIETPTYAKYTKPYLGKLHKRVCFGIVDEHQLKIWILNESCGQMEWVLKYEAEVGHYSQYVASIPYNNSGRQQDGSWLVEEDIDVEDTDHDVESQSEESCEWDSDNDDTITVNIESQNDYTDKHLDIMEFHPYKEVVFMAKPFGVVAYHLNSKQIQYLGNSRPKCYYRSHWSGIYESFLYTPCMIDDLLHGDQVGES